MSSLSSEHMPFGLTQRRQRRHRTEPHTVSWTRTVSLGRHRNWQGTVAAATMTAVQPVFLVLHAGVCHLLIRVCAGIVHPLLPHDVVEDDPLCFWRRCVSRRGEAAAC